MTQSLQDIIDQRRASRPQRAEFIDRRAALDLLDLPETADNLDWLKKAARPTVASIAGQAVELWALDAINRISDHLTALCNQLPPDR